ncbi:hypothetical protein [Streptobacillus moniliformis]|uniref:hypothetical protein n=1 Tax=Streptobacillus moniliformis TaxID=34105 RepID=UPI0007E3E27C|nr:hypothetical protein [Streptobacillus moniliformis]
MDKINEDKLDELYCFITENYRLLDLKINKEGYSKKVQDELIDYVLNMKALKEDRDYSEFKDIVINLIFEVMRTSAIDGYHYAMADVLEKLEKVYED